MNTSINRNEHQQIIESIDYIREILSLIACSRTEELNSYIVNNVAGHLIKKVDQLEITVDMLLK